MLIYCGINCGDDVICGDNCGTICGGDCEVVICDIIGDLVILWHLVIILETYVDMEMYCDNCVFVELFVSGNCGYCDYCKPSGDRVYLRTLGDV